MLKILANLTDLKGNNRYRRHSSIDSRTEIEDSGFKPAVPLWFSAAARPTKQDSGWVQAGGGKSV